MKLYQELHNRICRTTLSIAAVASSLFVLCIVFSTVSFMEVSASGLVTPTDIPMLSSNEIAKTVAVTRKAPDFLLSNQTGIRKNTGTKFSRFLPATGYNGNYRSELDDNEKKTYDALYQALVVERKNYTETVRVDYNPTIPFDVVYSNPDSDDLSIDDLGDIDDIVLSAAAAFFYDCPEAFWVQNTDLTVSAPAARSTAAYYAENAEATIQWNSVTNASYYLVDVNKDGKSIVKQEAVIDNFYKINKGNGNYEVYVTAVSGSNTKKSSRVSFTIGRLDTPKIANTAEYYEAGQNVSIKWNACVGATGYNISIIKDNQSTYVNKNLTTNSYTFSSEDGYYETRVEAKNENGGSQKTVSDIYSFCVGNKRLIAIDKSVTHFAHNGDVNLSWNDCEGVSDYTLEITDTNDSTKVQKHSVSGSSSYVVRNLPDGQYKAIVSAVKSTDIL